MRIITIIFISISTWGPSSLADQPDVRSLIEKAEKAADGYNKLRPWETKDTPLEKEALGKVLAACQKVIDAYPGTEYEAEMRYQMAMLYSERRDYKKKNDILDSIIKDFPTAKYAYDGIFARACDMQDANDYAKAINWYNKIPTDNEHHFTAMTEITYCLFMQGKDNEAFDSLLKLLSEYQSNEKFIKLRLQSEEMYLLPVLLEDGNSIYAVYKRFSGEEGRVPKGKENEANDIPITLIAKEKKNNAGIQRYCYLKMSLDSNIICGTKYSFGINKEKINPASYGFMCAEKRMNSWLGLQKPDKRISLLFGLLDSLTPEQCDLIFVEEQSNQAEANVFYELAKSIRSDGKIDIAKLRKGIQQLSKQQPELVDRLNKW